MKPDKLRTVLLIEVHRLIQDASRAAVSKLGRPVPAEAVEGFLSSTQLEDLRSKDPTVDFDDPLVQKCIDPGRAAISVLSYPPSGTISPVDASALESLQCSAEQRAVLERIVAEACHDAFFHFFCILDSVGDPEVMKQEEWLGAKFVYPRDEGPMLHEELGPAFYEFQAMAGG